MADRLTQQQRSYCMSRVGNKNTSIERYVFSALRMHGLKFRKHDEKLPGKPDVVFPKKKIAVFIDGDFWHGYRFPLWEGNLPPFWRLKIAKNRLRDKKNFAKLKRQEWNVVRIWGHQLKNRRERTIENLIALINRL